jgi:hypothetical protein
MLTLSTSIRLDGATGEEIFNFFVNPDDDSYRAWWPGTHLQLHTLTPGHKYLGDVVFMDEYIGKHRLRMNAIVIEAVAERKLAW